MEDLIAQIRKDIIALADKQTKEKIIKLTSGAKCYGVTVPKLRQLAKEYKCKLKNIDYESLLKTADKLFADKNREEILFIIFLLSNYNKEKENISWYRISRWIKHIDNWETCDQLSSNIVTDIIIKNIELSKELEALATSDNFWLRRFAIATVANMNHGGRQYPILTFDISKILLTDKEKMVIKAVGWAIREISKDCPNETIKFLNENENIISKSLLKESTELLPPKDKKQYL